MTVVGEMKERRGERCRCEDGKQRSTSILGLALTLIHAQKMARIVVPG